MAMRHAAWACVVLSACRGPGVEGPAPKASEAPRVETAPGAPTALEVPAVGAPVRPVVPLVALGESTGAASAGTVALARAGDRTVAFLADPDDRAVVTVDVTTREVLASTPLGARPSAVLVTRGGRLAALGADDAHVHLLALLDAAEPLVEERAVVVPAEPVSAALAVEGDGLLVACRWGHALALVPLTTSGPPIVVDLPRDPAAVLPAPDGRTALVVHAVGSRASVVDLVTHDVHAVSLDQDITRPIFSEEMMMPMPPPQALEPPNAVPDETLGQAVAPMPVPKKARPFRPQIERVTLHADQAFALVRTTDNRFLVPEALVETGPPQPTGGYGGGASASVSTSVATLSMHDGALGPVGDARVFGSRCLLPRGATLADDGKRLLVVCVGSDELTDVTLGRHAPITRRVVRVARGPSGVAFEPASRQAIVWSPFERAVSFVSLQKSAKGQLRTSVPRREEAPAEAVRRGRDLFHAVFDSRVSSDGRACASCHPDGRDDGLTWSAPGGARQTPMLFARLEGTAPFGWDGDAPDLRHHLTHTTSRLGGSGLSASNVADVEAYLAWLRAPVAPPLAGEHDALVARGRDVFHSPDAECGTCHGGDAMTDADTHDVASRAKGDRAKAFDTPSLRFVARSAPYFHDGRYASLDALVAGVDGTMGHTAQLTAGDRAALLAYLETL